MTTENVGKFVLFVEDDPDTSDLYTDQLASCGGGRYIALVAPTMQEAWKLVGSPGLCGVIVDGQVPETDGALIPPGFPTTLGFVEQVRANHPDLLMVAASGHPEFRAKLVGAGCNAEANKSKAVETLLELLAQG